MDYRPLGATGLQVSLLGFGCAPVGSRSGTSESRMALALALESGVTFFDTADMYGLGASEKKLAGVLGSRRASTIVATKCGYTFSTRLRAVAWIKPLLRPLVRRLKGVKASAAAVMSSQRSMCFEPDYIERCVHASMERLQTGRLQVFFLHDPPIEVVRRPDAFAKLAELKRAGKVEHYGVSSSADAVAASLTDTSGVTVAQVETNLLDPHALRTVLPLARQRGAGFIARAPFANGRIFRDERLLALLRKHNLPFDSASIASLSLRYLRSFEGVSSILPSMMRPEHIRGNLAALAGPPLSPAERAVCEALGAPVPGVRA